VISGYRGGWFGAVIMRIADVQLAVQPLLTALVVHGITRRFMTPAQREVAALWVLIVAEATLSFLGAGFADQPLARHADPVWTAVPVVRRGWILASLAGFLFTLSLSFNVLGDRLRDRFDTPAA
jgi:ABC-type dipeptide/oligopeptide/nickel transport system permease subunit